MRIGKGEFHIKVSLFLAITVMCCKTVFPGECLTPQRGYILRGSCWELSGTQRQLLIQNYGNPYLYFMCEFFCMSNCISMSSSLPPLSSLSLSPLILAWSLQLSDSAIEAITKSRKVIDNIVDDHRGTLPEHVWNFWTFLCCVVVVLLHYIRCHQICSTDLSLSLSLSFSLSLSLCLSLFLPLSLSLPPYPVVYGVTTGFGKFANVVISNTKLVWVK